MAALPPVDYDAIAPGYDHFRRGRGPYFQALVQAALRAPGPRFLELGAGTGNNTEAMLAVMPRARIIALERSAGMLAHGRRKAGQAAWVQGDALQLPFRAASFDFLYSTYFLHHISDLPTLFHACARVLAPGGRVAFASVPQEFVRRHPANAFFPSFAAIDCARFQPAQQILAALFAAGFGSIEAQFFRGEPRPLDAAYAEKIAARFISTYELIPDDEFQAGLRHLRAEIARNGTAGMVQREAVVFLGARS